MDSSLRQFAPPEGVLPAEAMRDAVARWEEVSPALLAHLDAYADGEHLDGFDADGKDYSEAAANAAFFIIFLMAQMRDTRAFARLLRIAQDNELLENALGDGVTASFAGILADTWDGALGPLVALAEAPTIDDFVRNAAFEALALLTAQDRIPREVMEATLRSSFTTLRTQRQTRDVVWAGWLGAVALLGFDQLRPQVQEVFRKRLVDAYMDRGHFDQDLAEGLAATTREARIALLARHHVASIDDAVALLSSWHGFSEPARAEIAARKQREAEATLRAALDPPPPPAPWPVFKVGRNEPCPCGSGRKFKKCCLDAA